MYGGPQAREAAAAISYGSSVRTGLSETTLTSRRANAGFSLHQAVPHHHGQRCPNAFFETFQYVQGKPAFQCDGENLASHSEIRHPANEFAELLDGIDFSDWSPTPSPKSEARSSMLSTRGHDLPAACANAHTHNTSTTDGVGKRAALDEQCTICFEEKLFERSSIGQVQHYCVLH